MTTPKNPPTKAMDELAAADVPWWRRYSRHGEFPWSTMTSMALHLFILVMMAAAAAPLLDYDRTPPSVDVLVVGEEPDAAPGEGDGLPEAGELNADAADDAMEPTPDAMDVTDVQDVTEPEPFEPQIDVPDVGTQFRDQEKQLQDTRDRLKDAREKLNRDLGKGTPSGTGTGGGGGSGASGKAARAARWILRFNIRSPQEYLTQIDGLGAHIAFPTSGDKYLYFYNASSGSRRSETRSLAANEMVYWVDDNAESVGRVASVLGIPPGPFMLSFLPQELEDRMVQLERAYNNLEEDEILSTVFEVVFRGGKYDVFVAAQTPK